MLKQRNTWPVVQPMSEPGEFVLAPRKLTVRDSVMQIGNNTLKSEASIQSRTALNAGEMENLVTDHLEAVQQREHGNTREFQGTQQVRDEDVSIKKEKNRANVATTR